MSTVKPAKIKAYLSGIKEAFLDNPPEPNVLSGAFLGVLKIELLLRGILVEDDEKIWNQIQSSVGKSLLVEQPSKLPKPLLAGANVVAGRIAEAFYNQLKTLISQQVKRGDGRANNFNFLRDLVPAEKAQGARQRAEDLQDERWLFLLSSNFPSNYDNETGIRNYANGVLQVAIGFYSTATSIQSDTPQMWKKLWDAWSLSGTVSDDPIDDPIDDPPPYEAQLAIENLIRIALARGNTKRASELQLRLVQSYLNPKLASLVGLLSVLPKKKRSDIASDTTIAQSFGDSFTQDLPSKQDKSKGDTIAAEKARRTLENCQSHFENTTQPIDSETILYVTLKVQSLLAEENARIQVEAKEMEQRSATKISIVDCTRRCRTSLIASSYNESDKEFLRQAIILRDTMIEAWGSAAASGEARKGLGLCFQYVNQSILRLKERAEVIGQKKSSYHDPWNDVIQFIIPILKEMDHQIANTEQIVDGDDEQKSVVVKWLSQISKEDGDIGRDACPPIDVIKTTVSIFPTVVWMMSGDGDRSIPPFDEELKLVVEILSGLIKLQENLDLRQQRKDTQSVGTTENASFTSILKWRNAKASALCFICQDDSSSIYRITNDAITSCKKEKKMGFVALLQCLVAWSGWFQNPWPYCTNLADARRLIASAESVHPRPLSSLERILLQLAKADAEFLNGGFVERAHKHYTEVLETLQNEELSIDNISATLLRAHCYNGMTRAQHAKQDFVDCKHTGSSFSRESLRLLEDLDLLPVIPSLWIWHMRRTHVTSRAYQLSVARQLIANSLIHIGQFEEARCFLEKGVADSPLDADAALALGAFQLRVTFYIDKSTEGRKEAQINLLKAAKLDPSRPNPFALLGIWYEATGDLKRAEGCFRKSLKLDPCNPVAGRGLLRVCSSSDCRDILDSAINRNSPLNGWAWKAVGLNKAYHEGDNSLAVVAILKALRCRDVALSDKENLGVFYRTPSSTEKVNQLSAALAEVGMCYRRLGRMTASIRAFHASIEATDLASVPHGTLISCAQVEQELGLFDEAAEKFSRVLERGESTSRSVALHGQAIAFFSIAERELMNGKIGTAFTYIQSAVGCCESSSMVSMCQFKLLGDLYSFGASFPSNTFSDLESQTHDHDSCIQRQLTFVSKGEIAYRSALNARTRFIEAEDDESVALKSSILCDVALNILLQAQLLSSKQSNAEKVNDKYHLAAEAFREAIDYNPIHAASWCGLGCSTLKLDPLLAQHAFCRCIQIENTFSDAYANVGFLYTSSLALTASKSTMEALTQIADTPMMWMNCAFILEREAEKHFQSDEGRKTEAFICQAADAYRASLQVNRHPEAQLGLSLTGRMQAGMQARMQYSDKRKLFDQNRKDCFSYMNEYIGASSSKNAPASVFQGIMSIEMGASVLSHRSWRDDIQTRGEEAAKSMCARENDSSLQKLKASTYSLFDGGKKKQSDSSVSVRNEEEKLQRQIWLDPDRGELWLTLAKLFVEKGSVRSARTAASRAADTLSRNLLTSSQKAVSFVDAKIISEATSLKYWLDEMEAVEATPASNYGMQRALMMDPTNLIARHKLVAKASEDHLTVAT